MSFLVRTPEDLRCGSHPQRGARRLVTAQRFLGKVVVISSISMGAAALLSGCAAPVTTQSPTSIQAANGLVMPLSTIPPYNGGGYYKDDGPGANPPAHLETVPDAVPRKEPLHRYANDTYRVMGVSYTPDTSGRPYKQKGLASWYGRKFHGKPTSSGETYDMYAMTAAHRTLPIPSFVRVTNVDNGRSVVLRVNDRGPFHNERLIDLSYTAAYKLDILKGVTRVEVERIDPERMDSERVDPTKASDPAPLAEPIRVYKAQEIPVIRAQSLHSEAVQAVGESIWLQLGAFGKRETAAQLQQQAGQVLGANLVIQREGGGLVRVQAGPFVSPAEADRASQTLSERLGLRPYRIAEAKSTVVDKAVTPPPSVPAEAVRVVPSGALAAVTPAAVSAPAVAPAPGLYLQVGVVSKAEAAEALIGRMGTAAGSGVYRIEAGTLIKVQTGPFATPAHADEAAAALEKILGVKPFRVTH